MAVRSSQGGDRIIRMPAAVRYLTINSRTYHAVMRVQRMRIGEGHEPIKVRLL